MDLDNISLQELKKLILTKLNTDDYTNIYIILKNSGQQPIVTKDTMFLNLSSLNEELIEIIKEMIKNK